MKELVKIDVSMEYSPKVYVYSRGPNWHWKFLLPNNVWFTGRAPGANKKHVERNARLKEKELAKGLFTQKEINKLQKSSSSLMTFEKATEAYIELLRSEDASPNYYTCLERQLLAVGKTFKSQFGVELVHEVNEEKAYMFRQYLLERVQNEEITRPTAFRILNDAKRLFKWLRKRKMIHQNPWIEVDAIPVPQDQKVRTVVPPIEIIPKLIATDYQHRFEFPIKEFAYSLFRIGARLKELLYLELNDLDWDTGVWHIQPKTCPTPYGMKWAPKNRKSRVTLVPQDVLTILQPLRERALQHKVVGYSPNKVGVVQPFEAEFLFTMRDSKLSKKGEPKVFRRVDDVSGSWRRLFKAAGIVVEPDTTQLWHSNEHQVLTHSNKERVVFTRHDMRRAFNLNAIEAGMSLEERALLLGHGQSVNQNHYCGKPTLDTAKISDFVNHKMGISPSSKLLDP